MSDPPPSSNRHGSAWDHPDLHGGRPCRVRACLYAQPKWIILFTWWEVQSPRDGSWWENDALSSYPELRAMRQSSLTRRVLLPTALLCLSLCHSTPPQKLLRFFRRPPWMRGWENLAIFFFFRPSAFALQCFFVPAPKIMGQTCISLFRWLPLFTPRLIAAFISLINLAVRLWLVDWADKMCCYSEPGRSLFHDITPPFAGRPSSREKWSRFSRETGGGEHIQSITRHLLQSNQLSSAPIGCIYIYMCNIWIALC